MLVKCWRKNVAVRGGKTVVTLQRDDAGVFSAHLSRGLDSLPDAEVTDEPDGGQTQSQPPADWTQLV